ncbi:MAG: hypothetical protein ACXVEF_37205 [Polyangiales bacterium]
MTGDGRDTNDKKPKRSLPVVGNPKRAIDDVNLGEDSPAAKSPGGWIILGALSTFAFLTPLAMLAMAVLKGMFQNPAATKGGWGALVAMGIAIVALSSFGGGYVVGRFGLKCGPREGALSGALAGLAMWGFSHLPTGVAILAVTVPSAYFGARRGRRARQPGDTIGQ